jgi:hypothetical protein
MGFQKPIDAGFRDEVTPRIGEGDRQFPWAELRLIQGKFYDLAADDIRYPCGSAPKWGPG